MILKMAGPISIKLGCTFMIASLGIWCLKLLLITFFTRDSCFPWGTSLMRHIYLIIYFFSPLSSKLPLTPNLWHEEVPKCECTFKSRRLQNFALPFPPFESSIHLATRRDGTCELSQVKPKTCKSHLKCWILFQRVEIRKESPQNMFLLPTLNGRQLSACGQCPHHHTIILSGLPCYANKLEQTSVRGSLPNSVTHSSHSPFFGFPDSELVFRDAGGGLSILDVDTDLQRQIVSNKIFVSTNYRKIQSSEIIVKLGEFGKNTLVWFVVRSHNLGSFSRALILTE